MKRGRGRPKGRVDWRRGAKRRQRPIAHVLCVVSGLQPHTAALIASAFDRADFVLVTIRGELRFAVLKELNADGRERTLSGAAGRLVRSGFKPEGRTTEETIWHNRCAEYFFSALFSAVKGNRDGENRNLDELAYLDAEWPDRWRRFISAILNAPARLDLQPYEVTPLPRGTSALMRAIALHRGRDIGRIFRASSGTSAAAT